MSENRKNCVLCGSKIVLKYTTQLPVFMGTIQNIINYKISPYTICECENCGEVMIKELLDLTDVYLTNHNVDIVRDL